MGIELAASNLWNWIGLIIALVLMLVGISYSRKTKKEKATRLAKKQEELEKNRKPDEDLK